MNCEAVKELLWAYLEKEATEEENSKIEAHLANCQACREELEAQKEIKKALSGLPDEELPEGYHTELMEKWTKGSVTELGFNPRVMSGCMRYVSQIVSVLGKDDSVIHKALMKVVDKTESTLRGIKDKKEVGDDTKKISYQILQADVAVRYLTTIVTTVQKLLNKCVKQVYMICKKYEEAMIPEIS